MRHGKETSMCCYIENCRLIPSCPGKYKGGLKPSPDELANILNNKQAGFKKLWSDDFCEADLRRANLMDANLGGVNFAGANLAGANLPLSIFTLAHLESANLTGADLSKTILINAQLSGANLSHANLTGAILTFANLAGATLSNARLTGATFASANLKGVDFDVSPISLPDPFQLSSAEGLESVKFFDEPTRLVKLRSQFKDIGPTHSGKPADMRN